VKKWRRRKQPHESRAYDHTTVFRNIDRVVLNDSCAAPLRCGTPAATLPTVTTGNNNVPAEHAGSASQQGRYLSGDQKEHRQRAQKIHDDRLSSLGGGKYFACVDMKGKDGTIYDIDFFMAGQPSSMNVTETSVHKINGKPLYNWKEEGGIWKKVRVS
jgi:hypothetical protein